MHAKYHKEVWSARFQKMLKSEEDSLAFYKRLLSDGEKLLSNTKAKSLLEEILHDEMKHAQIVRELIHLLDKKEVSEEKNKGEPHDTKTISSTGSKDTI